MKLAPAAASESSEPCVEQNGRVQVSIVGPPLRFMYGGQEVQTQNLIDSWNGDPIVFAKLVSSRPGLPRGTVWANDIPYLRTIVRLPLYLASLLGVATRTDILHVMAGSFSSFALVAIPAFAVNLLCDMKLLIHYHSGRGEDHLRMSYVARYLLRNCDRVVVPSEFLAEAFRKHKIHAVVIPNLIDPERFRFRLRRPLQPRMLCTRNWEQHYRIDVVLRAFARVQQEFSNATLCLVGRGSRDKALRRLAQDLNLRNLDFRGAIPPAQISRIYDECDIFLNGSDVDCSPVSVLESFCAGLPVITTASGGIPFTVEHERTGLLSPPGDPLALASNVIRVLRHQELAESLATQARAVSLSHSWPGVRASWLNVYGSMLARRAPNGT